MFSSLQLVSKIKSKSKKTNKSPCRLNASALLILKNHQKKSQIKKIKKIN